MLKKKIVIAFVLCLFAIMTMGAGCSVSFGSKKDTSATDGGFWVSPDKGLTWTQVSSVPSPAGAGSINGLDISSLALDPEDLNAIYFGSAANGLYYTYNIASGWVKATGLNEPRISAVAVSPDNKCIIFVAAGSKVYRSSDCNRTWTQIYFDNDLTTRITAIAVDFYDAKKVYVGNSRGQILKSLDRGDHWVVSLPSGSSINEIVFSPTDSRKIFVTTASEGLYRTTDAGDTWTPMKEKMAEFKNAFNIVNFIASPSTEGLYFAATAYGLLKSTDSGDTWTRIQLVTPEQNASINSLAVNPKNPKEIYYVTNTTFYSSIDGGTSWRTKKLPSTRAGWRLLVKPDEVNVLFMGMKKYQPSNSLFGN